MGFVFESPIGNTSKFKPNNGLGISLSSDTKLFSTLYDISKQAKENLKFLLLTQVGERYMIPDFGCELLDIIFQPNVFELKEEIGDIIGSAIDKWLPYISIENLDIKTAEDDPLLGESVQIVLTFSVDNSNTDILTILINNSELTVT